MTYEQWCKGSKDILAEAEQYNEFRRAAMKTLLEEAGPRISKLSGVMYMGCGFHYSMEQSFAKLVEGFSLPWQPCANWCEKIEEEQFSIIARKVAYNMLLRQIQQAERSAIDLAQSPTTKGSKNEPA